MDTATHRGQLTWVLVCAINICLFLATPACNGNNNDDSGENSPAPELFDCETLLQTEQGGLTGKNSGNGACEYFGIPFAAPPVGENRFRAPQPAQPREEVLRAVKPGNACIQGLIPGLWEVGDEDCLYLNVWRPQEISPEPYPVMVFIFGGGFTIGAGTWGVYNGSQLANYGVIVVTINYRLGYFGYLSLPELKAEDPDGSHGNYGILDQMAALAWVRNNISAFGGDAQNVTAFGESAGGMSICTMMAAEPAEGLFDKAIIESGGCTIIDPEQVGFEQGRELFLEPLGCESSDSEQVLDCIRNATVDEIFEKATIPMIGGSLYPHIDGYIATEPPLDKVREGRAMQVPLLTGSNSDEIRLLFVVPPVLKDISENWDEFYLRMTDLFGAEEVGNLKVLYPQQNYVLPFDMWGDICSDIFLGAPTRIAAQYHSQYMPTYHYIFAWDHFEVGQSLGSFHSWELGFIFGITNSYNYWLMSLEEIKATESLSHAMQRYWTNFAKTGDPNGSGDFYWPLLSEGGQSIILDSPPSLEKDLILARSEYWTERAPHGFDDMIDFIGLRDVLDQLQ
jgi:para-nitrobenzyl esterase